MYFNLVRVYGDVPLVLKEISISESYDILREPKENVYNQIIADLKEAQGLPVPIRQPKTGVPPREQPKHYWQTST